MKIRYLKMLNSVKHTQKELTFAATPEYSIQLVDVGGSAFVCITKGKRNLHVPLSNVAYIELVNEQQPQDKPR